MGMLPRTRKWGVLSAAYGCSSPSPRCGAATQTFCVFCAFRRGLCSANDEMRVQVSIFTSIVCSNLTVAALATTNIDTLAQARAKGL